jgi:hypothetical protein
MHKLIGELLAFVPPDGSPWSRPARQRWVAAMEAVLDVLYEDAPLSTRVSAVETTTGTNPTPFVDGPRVGAPQDEQSRPPHVDTSFILDLRSWPGAGSGQGRHARPGTADS